MEINRLGFKSSLGYFENWKKICTCYLLFNIAHVDVDAEIKVAKTYPMTLLTTCACGGRQLKLLKLLIALLLYCLCTLICVECGRASPPKHVSRMDGNLQKKTTRTAKKISPLRSNNFAFLVSVKKTGLSKGIY